ncbi:MAG: hypothetical protein JXR78_13805 [Victivallales bacterium]|nr:hypothetical protein [Victivallales bacterium]
MYTIKTNQTQFSLDDKGMLVSLLNRKSNHDYAGGKGLWRIIYSRGSDLERMILPESNEPEISQLHDGIRLSYRNVMDTEGFKLNVELTITAQVDNEDIILSAEIINNEAGIVVREFHFPLIRHCALPPDSRLILSTAGGEHYDSPYETVLSRQTGYMAKDNLEIRMSTLYPGFAAVNAFVLENGKEGLYFGSHDHSFQFTLHLIAADKDGLIPMMVKYPFIKHGASWNAEGYILAPYSGSWHIPAKKYRKWADTWFTPRNSMQKVRDMKGWQRIILRHQYGETHYHYNQLEQIFHDGMTSGIDTVLLFGWHRDGMDAGYPDYVPDPDQGGATALKKNILKIKNAGGKVILYFNGQLIDVDTDFYRNIGHQISVKKANGSEHMETYGFSGNGTALREFGNKTFVTACPGCEEWLTILKSCVDIAVDSGADSVFFDQLGWVSRPCFDVSHGHPVPFMTTMKTKSEMLRALSEYTKIKCPDMPLGIEWLSDITVQYADYVHNIQKPEQSFFLEWFRYIFPEIRISDRGIRDDENVEQKINHSLLRGLFCDVEIYRCRKTIIECPLYQEYLKKANLIRDKYSDLILNGMFRDDDFAVVQNENVLVSCFTSKDRLAVILTPVRNKPENTTVKVSGFDFIEADGLNEWEVKNAGNCTYGVTLGENGLTVIIFQKKRNS